MQLESTKQTNKQTCIQKQKSSKVKKQYLNGVNQEGLEASLTEVITDGLLPSKRSADSSFLDMALRETQKQKEKKKKSLVCKEGEFEFVC